MVKERGILAKNTLTKFSDVIKHALQIIPCSKAKMKVMHRIRLSVALHSRARKFAVGNLQEHEKKITSILFMNYIHCLAVFTLLYFKLYLTSYYSQFY